MLLRRALRRFLRKHVLLGRVVRVFKMDKVPRNVFRRERFIEGVYKLLRRQKHVLSQITTPLACILSIRSEKLQNESSLNFSNLHPELRPEFCSEFSPIFLSWELRNIYHHHAESKKRKSSEPLR